MGLGVGLGQGLPPKIRRKRRRTNLAKLQCNPLSKYIRKSLNCPLTSKSMPNSFNSSPIQHKMQCRTPSRKLRKKNPCLSNLPLTYRNSHLRNHIQPSHYHFPFNLQGDFPIFNNFTIFLQFLYVDIVYMSAKAIPPPTPTSQ